MGAPTRFDRGPFDDQVFLTDEFNPPIVHFSEILLRNNSFSLFLPVYPSVDHSHDTKQKHPQTSFKYVVI